MFYQIKLTCIVVTLTNILYINVLTTNILPYEKDLTLSFVDWFANIAINGPN